MSTATQGRSVVGSDVQLQPVGAGGTGAANKSSSAERGASSAAGSHHHEHDVCGPSAARFALLLMGLLVVVLAVALALVADTSSQRGDDLDECREELDGLQQEPEPAWALVEGGEGAVWPGARLAHSAVQAGTHKMLLFGGVQASDALGDFYEFDERTGAWSALPGSADDAGAPSPRLHHSAVVVGHTMLVFGGFAFFGPNSTGTDTLHAYSLESGSWTNLTAAATGTPPSARGAHEAVAYGGVMYVFGGWEELLNNRPLNDLHAYDPAQQAWTALAPAGDVPSPRLGFSMVMEPNDLKIYVWAGKCGADGSELCNDMYTLSAPAGGGALEFARVEASGDVPAGRVAAHSEVARGTHLYAFGGLGAGQVGFGTLHEFDVVARRWAGVPEDAASAERPSPRFGHSVVGMDRHLFVFGGRCKPVEGNPDTPITPCNDLWRFTLPDRDV